MFGMCVSVFCNLGCDSAVQSLMAFETSMHIISLLSSCRCVLFSFWQPVRSMGNMENSANCVLLHIKPRAPIDLSHNARFHPPGLIVGQSVVQPVGAATAGPKRVEKHTCYTCCQRVVQRHEDVPCCEKASMCGMNLI